ncbi:hypothetical protein SK141_1802 [Streptococcus oralis]|nr:hypothetical protein SK141_1802 [Streptococcus oralis]
MYRFPSTILSQILLVSYFYIKSRKILVKKSVPFHFIFTSIDLSVLAIIT